MKHILNNLSEEEKNSIRELHTGGMKLKNENFSRLVNSKLGDSKPLLKENKGLINEGFAKEFNKDQAIGIFRDENKGVQGTVIFDPGINQIVFTIGSRKFFITELKPSQQKAQPTSIAPQVSEPTQTTQANPATPVGSRPVQ